MPWYKVYITYGPGHMASFTEYAWSPDDLNDEYKRELIEQFIPSYWDYPIGRCEMVDKLPPEVSKYKMVFYKQQIENAEFMLGILNSEEGTK